MCYNILKCKNKIKIVIVKIVGAFIDTTGKVQSQMILMIKQHLNYITPKNTNFEKMFEKSFLNYFCRHH